MKDIHNDMDMKDQKKKKISNILESLSVVFSKLESAPKRLNLLKNGFKELLLTSNSFKTDLELNQKDEMFKLASLRTQVDQLKLDISKLVPELRNSLYKMDEILTSGYPEVKSYKKTVINCIMDNMNKAETLFNGVKKLQQQLELDIYSNNHNDDQYYETSTTTTADDEDDDDDDDDMFTSMSSDSSLNTKDESITSSFMEKKQKQKLPEQSDEETQQQQQQQQQQIAATGEETISSNTYHHNHENDNNINSSNDTNNNNNYYYYYNDDSNMNNDYHYPYRIPEPIFPSRHVSYYPIRPTHYRKRQRQNCYNIISPNFNSLYTHLMY